METGMECRRRRRFTGGCALLAAGVLVAASFSEKPALADSSDPILKKLERFSVRNIRKHQLELQRIADRNGDTRFAGSTGYDESALYVADELADAGYDVELQEFDFIAFSQLSPSTLEQTAPGSVVYEENVDYALMSQTDAGDVSGPVASVDLALADPESSTSGCEPADFAGFPTGGIALMQRGTCSFQDKAENAAATGAVGAVIFNQGNGPDRVDLFGGTLSPDVAP